MLGLTKLCRKYIRCDFNILRHISIGRVNNIPAMQVLTGIPRNTQPKSCIICYHSMCVSGNSLTMHCGMPLKMPYFLCVTLFWLYFLCRFAGRGRWEVGVSAASPSTPSTHEYARLCQRSRQHLIFHLSSSRQRDRQRFSHPSGVS